jgi:predicted transposase
MKQTLAVKLAPTPDQLTALLATMERFNACCDWLASIAFRERCANKIELQKRVYYEARERFGLASQLTIRAIGKTVDAYKRDKAIRPRFKPHGAIPYDQRIMSWRGIEAVSLLTLSGRVVVPIRFGAYQAARLDRVKGQADLVYRDGTFFLYATIEAPEPTPVEPDDYLGVDLGIASSTPARPSSGTAARSPTGAAISRSEAPDPPRASSNCCVGSKRGTRPTPTTSSASVSLPSPKAPGAGSPSKSSAVSAPGPRFVGASGHDTRTGRSRSCGPSWSTRRGRPA